MIRLGTLAVALAVVLVQAPAASAKFEMSLSVRPVRPVVGVSAHVTVRTDVVLRRKHGLRLDVVGPWRDAYGQAFLEPRLVRIGPRTFSASVRFPYPGRWRLIVPNWGAPGSASPPPVDRAVTVLPRR